jgi:hypothetical protein
VVNEPACNLTPRDFGGVMKKFIRLIIDHPELLLVIATVGVGIGMLHSKGAFSFLAMLVTAKDYDTNVIMAAVFGTFAIALSIVVVTIVVIQSARDVINWVNKHAEFIIWVAVSSVLTILTILAPSVENNLIVLPSVVVGMCILILAITLMAYITSVSELEHGVNNVQFHHRSWQLFWEFIYQSFFFVVCIVPWIIGFFSFFIAAGWELGSVAAAKLTNFCMGYKLHDNNPEPPAEQEIIE